MDSKSETEALSFNGMSQLKTQWESGSINGNQKDSSIVDNELAELRQNKSEPLKQAYERALEAKSSETLAKPENLVPIKSPVKTDALKKKFENLESDHSDDDKLDGARREREEEISRLAESETITKEARNKFKQIDCNSEPQSPAIQSSKQVEDVSIDPNDLQQRFKYFENLKEQQQSLNKEVANDEIVNDIPKVDTTKKMLDKFKALEAGQQGEQDSVARAPRRITPPRETAKVYESEPITDPDIGKTFYNASVPFVLTYCLLLFTQSNRAIKLKKSLQSNRKKQKICVPSLRTGKQKLNVKAVKIMTKKSMCLTSILPRTCEPNSSPSRTKLNQWTSLGPGSTDLW